MLISRRILCCFSLLLCLSGCAGGDKSPNAATQNVAQDNSDVVNFVADTSPMPDAKPWIDDANQGGVAAQFVMQMMYLDKIGDVSHLEDGQQV